MHGCLLYVSISHTSSGPLHRKWGSSLAREKIAMEIESAQRKVGEAIEGMRNNVPPRTRDREGSMIASLRML